MPKHCHCQNSCIFYTFHYGHFCGRGGKVQSLYLLRSSKDNSKEVNVLKRKWEKPTLDILEISQTMKFWSSGGGGSDNDDDCEPISGES
ncbi:paeninodin family lasso peptide [Sutcliffiella horikoshii]|uniref:Paeninodin family lasso peptide n=1 Tax=Sutcliffiella horikoshii TaxID=79883 RepID=A0AA95B6U3_9BACI|nr:paeninodin family lasso peptide [Sutcliffiella horikoshii]